MDHNLVPNKDALQAFVDNPKWKELVTEATEERQRILEAVVTLIPKDVDTFLKREQLIGQANAIKYFVEHITQQQEQVKEETIETNET